MRNFLMVQHGGHSILCVKAWPAGPVRESWLPEMLGAHKQAATNWWIVAAKSPEAARRIVNSIIDGATLHGEVGVLLHSGSNAVGAR